MVTRYRATVQEYLSRCDEPPFSEYADGEIFEKAMPDWLHALIVKRLTLLFAAFEAEHGGVSGPEIRIELATARGREFRIPDYAYWAPGRPSRAGRFGAAPTIAVEVRSPDESLADQRAKCRAYRAAGIPAAWLVNPADRTAEVFDSRHDGRVLVPPAGIDCPAVPGLRVSLDELFSGLEDA